MVTFEGDIRTLPSMHRLRCVCLAPDEVLSLSFDDLKGAFYLLDLGPHCTFNVEYEAAELGLEDTYGPGRVYLGCRVVPVGWRSAVGLVQFVHRASSAVLSFYSRAWLGGTPT